MNRAETFCRLAPIALEEFDRTALGDGPTTPEPLISPRASWAQAEAAARWWGRAMGAHENHIFRREVARLLSLNDTEVEAWFQDHERVRWLGLRP